MPFKLMNDEIIDVQNTPEIEINLSNYKFLGNKNDIINTNQLKNSILEREVYFTHCTTQFVSSLQ